MSVDLTETEAKMLLKWASCADEFQINIEEEDRILIRKILETFPNLKREWEFLLK